MDFKLTEEQTAFAEAATTLFQEHCSDDALRAHDASGEPFQRALWPACVEMGLHGIVVPEAAGGLGLGLTELMGVLEAQGRALALVPLWEHQLAAAALAKFGTAALRERVLPAVLAGEAMLTVSLAALADPHGVALRFEPSGSDWLLQGRAAAVPLGADASHALLGVQCGGEARLLLLDLATPGIGRTPGTSQHHLGIADLQFDGVQLGNDTLLDPAAHAWFESRAIACVASLQLGVTGEQLKRTVAYVSERKQFGRAIGSFQLVTGQLADASIQLEAMRSALWQLVYRLDAGLGALPQALAVRAQAADVGHFAGHHAQHVHGGVGVDVSAPAHRFLYWSRALATALGAPAAHMERLGDWLADHDRLGWKYNLPEDDAA